jgi:signal transduction histidine kinase
VLGELARGVYPDALRRDGPAVALSELPKTRVQVEVDDLGLGRHDQEIEAGVYFSCLEAIQNACKHGSPRLVRVQLACENDNARFVVDDDGTGFDADRVVTDGGLRMLTDRVQALSGTVLVHSAPGRETVVSGWIPLRPVRVT